jgi:hypothetical protein
MHFICLGNVGSHLLVGAPTADHRPTPGRVGKPLPHKLRERIQSSIVGMSTVHFQTAATRFSGVARCVVGVVVGTNATSVGSGSFTAVNSATTPAATTVVLAALCAACPAAWGTCTVGGR